MARAAEVAVVGAGVFGLTTALRLTQAGLTVRVYDGTPGAAPNASAVAAGMLAPVSETMAENGDAEQLRWLMTARDLWPAFAQSVCGLALDRSGLDWRVADAAGMASIIARLCAWGIDFAPLPPPHLGLHLADDWRLDASIALRALRAALHALGVGVDAATVAADAEGDLRIDGRPLREPIVVIAAGHAGRDLAAAAPELARLSPIKGQLVAFAPGGPQGPTVRGAGLYVAPQTSGARAGATMEPGRSDLAIDAEVVERLHGEALAVAPGLAGLPHRGEAGVRAATPDGWPLAGPSRKPGVFLATGARRNGWLLAPLVSQIVAQAIAGGESPTAGDSLAQAFHPGRFTR